MSVGREGLVLLKGEMARMDEEERARKREGRRTDGLNERPAGT